MPSHEAQAHPRYPGSPDLRFVKLRSFPYLVLYRVGPDRVEIIAVAHAKRRPGYWEDRLER